MKFKFSVAPMLLLLVYFSAMATFPTEDAPPQKRAFGQLNRAKTLKFDFSVAERKTYGLEIQFIPDPKGAPLSKIWEVGCNSKPSMRIGDICAPLKAMTRLYRKGWREPLFSEVNDAPRTLAIYGGRYARLITAPLEPGEYLVEVEILQLYSEFAGVDIFLTMSESHHGK